MGWLSGIYDFDNPDNPFFGWTLIHVPYCTGDIHWGDATVEYSDELTIHHRGYRNTMAVFDWMKTHYPGAERVVSTGCSAGAYGAIGHAPKLAELYPDSELTVIADGGSGVITDDFLSGSFPNWNAEANMPLDLEGIAGRAIEDLTLVDFYVAVAQAFPEMRVAQHTTAFDKDQIFYYSVMGGDEAEFNPILEASLASISEQADNFRYYMAPAQCTASTPMTSPTPERSLAWPITTGSVSSSTARSPRRPSPAVIHAVTTRSARAAPRAASRVAPVVVRGLEPQTPYSKTVTVLEPGAPMTTVSPSTLIAAPKEPWALGVSRSSRSGSWRRITCAQSPSTGRKISTAPDS